MRKKQILQTISIILILATLLSIFSVVTTAETKNTVQNGTEILELAYIVGEIESMRTENEKVFKMSDGSMQLAIYSTPIQYQNEDGEWEEINNSLKENDSEGYVTKNTKDEIIF